MKAKKKASKAKSTRTRKEKPGKLKSRWHEATAGRFPDSIPFGWGYPIPWPAGRPGRPHTTVFSGTADAEAVTYIITRRLEELLTPEAAKRMVAAAGCDLPSNLKDEALTRALQQFAIHMKTEMMGAMETVIAEAAAEGTSIALKFAIGAKEAKKVASILREGVKRHLKYHDYPDARLKGLLPAARGGKIPGFQWTPEIEQKYPDEVAAVSPVWRALKKEWRRNRSETEWKQIVSLGNELKPYRTGRERQKVDELVELLEKAEPMDIALLHAAWRLDIPSSYKVSYLRKKLGSRRTELT